MLNVYAAKWCPHCSRTVEFLKTHKIPYKYHEMEEEPASVISKVVEVNGGEDWVVPTLEYNGQWRPGQVFSAEKLERDLRAMGVME
ncbi:glutaredoxin domain-containing protein [Victivallis sp. Marseille-Q1083]|uniref:glutaredoxin family protein n=1 Tax=Victivallis sp. Marseille-Q1083 TaxID=2717288 RepID=UPI00158C9967|nr:glutaredoxin domain-containing protein [Victivallis sp. Marseille-Q1083]